MGLVFVYALLTNGISLCLCIANWEDYVLFMYC